METRVGARFRMSAEFLKEDVLNGSTGDMTDALEPLTHEPRRVIESPCVIARVDSYRNKPCLGVLLTTPSEFLADPNIPVITERLKTLLALTAWNEQAESSDIPRILGQIAHRQ